MRSNTYTPKDRPDDKVVPRWIPLLAVPALVFLLACPGQKKPQIEPPTTTDTEGYILVDSPEVFGRERLIRDREQQKKWLKEQLTIPDEAFDAIQAQVQSRSLSSSKFSFGIDATAATGLGIRQADAQSSDLAREQEIADLNHQIQIAKLQNDLEQVRAGKTLTSMPVATETGSGTASGGEGAAGSGSAAGGAAATGGSTAAPAAAPSAGASPALPNFAAATLAVKDSPINRFRDRLAYRELVRQELLENDLDDAHDLLGNTLYRWTFDTTVFPGKDASRWAIVEVELVSQSACNLKAEGSELLQLMKGLEAAVERMVAYDISNATRIFLDENSSTVDLETAGILRTNQFSDLRSALIQRTRFVQQVKEQIEITGLERASARTKKESEDFDSSLRYLTTRLAAEEMELARLRADVTQQMTDEIRDSYQDEINLRGTANYLQFEKNERGHVSVSVIPKGYPCANKLKCQLQTFCELVGKLPSRVEPYAVTPKESVERIADLAIANTTQELLLSAGLSAGSIGFDSALEKIQQLETQRQAVRRQPLVVGFASQIISCGLEAGSQCSDPSSAQLARADARQHREKERPKESGTASQQMPQAESAVAHSDKKSTGKPYRVGWILGPSFAPRYGEPGFDFFQKANQIPLAAVVSVPAWWLSAEVKVRTCWLAGGSHASALCDSKQEATMKIELPGSANELARTLFPRARRPQPFFYKGTPDLEIGRAERVVIYGDNLWRNPTVWLGSQQAVDVEILPDMKGIAATFDKVRQPPGWTPKQTFDLAAVWVWTSEGNAVAGDVRIYKPVTPPKEQKTPALFDVKSEVSFIRVDKDNRGAIGLNFKFDQKEEKGTKVNTIPKVFLVVENAILDPSQTPEAPPCLNKSAVPWEIKDSCRVEVHLQGLSPGQIVTVKTYRMDGKDEVPGDPISLEVR